MDQSITEITMLGERFCQHLAKFITSVILLSKDSVRQPVDLVDELLQGIKDVGQATDTNVLGDSELLHYRAMKLVPMRFMSARWQKYSFSMMISLDFIIVGGNSEEVNMAVRDDLIESIKLWRETPVCISGQSNESQSTELNSTSISSGPSEIPAVPRAPQVSNFSVTAPNDYERLIRLDIGERQPKRTLVTYIPERPESLKKINLLKFVPESGECTLRDRQLYGQDIYGDYADLKKANELGRDKSPFSQGFDVLAQPSNAVKFIKATLQILRTEGEDSPMRIAFLHDKTVSVLNEKIRIFLARPELLSVPPEIKFPWLLKSLEEAFIDAKCHLKAHTEAINFKYSSNHTDVYHYMQQLSEKFAEAKFGDLDAKDSEAIKTAFYSNLREIPEIREVMERYSGDRLSYLEYAEKVARKCPKNISTSMMNSIDVSELFNMEKKRRKPDEYSSRPFSGRPYPTEAAADAAMKMLTQHGKIDGQSKGQLLYDIVQRLCKRCNDGIHPPWECFGKIHEGHLKCKICGRKNHRAEECRTEIKSPCSRCGCESIPSKKRGHSYTTCDADDATVKANPPKRRSYNIT